MQINGIEIDLSVDNELLPLKTMKLLQGEKVDFESIEELTVEANTIMALGREGLIDWADDALKTQDNYIIELPEDLPSTNEPFYLIPVDEILKSISPKEETLDQVISRKGLKVESCEGSLKHVVTMAMVRKSKRADYHPTEEELALIHERITLEDIEPEQGYVFEVHAANTDPDRGDERFEEKPLKKLGQKGIENTIPLLLASIFDSKDHTWKAINSKGNVFDAFIDNGKLIYKVFIKNTKFNEEAIEGLFSGQLSKVSVGFSMNPMDYECSACKKPIVLQACPHQPGEMDKSGNKVLAVIKDIEDNFEISLVAVPMQPKARVRRNSFETTETGFTVSGEATVLDTGMITQSQAMENLGLRDYLNTSKAVMDTMNVSGLTFNEVLELPATLVDDISKALNGNDGTIINDTIQDNKQMDESTVEKKEDVAVEAPAPETAKEVIVEVKEVVKEVPVQSPELVEKIDSLSTELKALKETSNASDTLKALEEKVTKLAEALVKMHEDVTKKLEIAATVPAAIETKTYTKAKTVDEGLQSIFTSLRSDQ